MKLKLFLCIFFLGIAPLHSSELKPKELKTRDLLLFANPFATFEPSIVSKGHVKAFDDIDKMSYEQKVNLKKFINELKLLKIFGTLVPSALICIISFKYGELHNLKPVFKFAGALFFLNIWCANSEYTYKLHKFKNKIDQSLSDEKK